MFMKKSMRGTEGKEIDTLSIWNDSFIPSVLVLTEGFERGRDELLFKKVNLKRD